MSLSIKSFIFLMGPLASNMILSAASAIPAAVSEASYGIETLTFHGTHYDQATDSWFDLYSPVEHNMTNEGALESYWMNLSNSTSDVDARASFFDCNYSGTNSGLKALGCGAAHAIGGFVIAAGATATGGYIQTELTEAFNGKRDNQKPRSVCITRDNDNLCTSWANYDTAKLRNGESGDISNFAVMCGQSKGSAEFKTTMSDGGILYICVSNRATGCGGSVCGV